MCRSLSGERQAYREGQEDQSAGLGLVLNAVVPWNTRSLDAAVARLRAEGHAVKDEDVARPGSLPCRSPATAWPARSATAAGAGSDDAPPPSTATTHTREPAGRHRPLARVRRCQCREAYGRKAAQAVGAR